MEIKSFIKCQSCKQCKVLELIPIYNFDKNEISVFFLPESPCYYEVEILINNKNLIYSPKIVN